MSTFLSIQALVEDGVPKKAIARQLGVDVRTVRRYVRCLEEGDTEPRKSRSPSKLDPHRERIAAMVEQGFSATQIFQELSPREDFEASYPTLRRLVRKLRRVEPEVYCRLQFSPAEEAQVDFGSIGPIPVEGRMRRVHLFVVTLCHSRYAYYELVCDQTVPTFLGALRRAFEYFGGAPRRLKPDNLKSAVLIDQLGQRYYQEDFFRFCRHYGVVPDAARPATPTDKGRCERDIGYAKGNCFRAREFSSFEEAQTHLAAWREEIANVRLHGTTQRRPVDLFAEERAQLTPLPEEPFEICRWGRYRVRKDCHIHVEGNHYSVPHPHVGGQVTVRISEDHITAFAEGDVVASHERVRGRGQTITDTSHYPRTKQVATKEIHRQRCSTIRTAGPHAAEFLRALRHGPWVFGPQVRQLATLIQAHGADAVDQACRRALFFNAADGSGVIERILERDLHRIALPDDSARPTTPGRDYGRPLSEYAQLLEVAS